MKIFRNRMQCGERKTNSGIRHIEDLRKEKMFPTWGLQWSFIPAKMFSFNLLGTEIWKICDGKTVEEIVSALRESFEVEEEALRKDVNAFLENLKKEGLIYEE